MSRLACDRVPTLTSDLSHGPRHHALSPHPSPALDVTFPQPLPHLTLDVDNSAWASPFPRHGSKIMVCEKDPALKNRCHIRYMHLFSTIKYKVSISVSNALGHNATAITFDEFTIGAWGGGEDGLLHIPV